MEGPVTSGGKRDAILSTCIITKEIKLHAVDKTMGILKVGVIIPNFEDGHSRKCFALPIVHGTILRTFTNNNDASLSRVSGKLVALSTAIMKGLFKTIRPAEGSGDGEQRDDKAGRSQVQRKVVLDRKSPEECTQKLDGASEEGHL